MAISLQKGGNVNLSKEAPNLTKVIVGLGWDPRSTDGAAFDRDGSAFLLKSDAKVRGDNDFIFYNNLKSSDGSVVHNGSMGWVPMQVQSSSFPSSWKRAKAAARSPL